MSDDGVNMDMLIAYRDNLERLIKDMPDIMNSLTVGEGVRVASEAKRLTKDRKIVSTGNYRNSWHSDTKAMKTGDLYHIDVYNNADYAKHIEYGSRGHWVPGTWEGNTFVYRAGAKTGMYVRMQAGRYVLRDALQRQSVVRKERLQRLFTKIARGYLDAEGVAREKAKRAQRKADRQQDEETRAEEDNEVF